MKRPSGRWRQSLRGRLLVGTVIWILASVLLAGWALSDLFRQHITRQLHSELTIHMNQLVAALSVDEQGTPTLAFDLSDPRIQQPYSGLYWQIDQLSANGVWSEALFRSRSLWDQMLRLPSQSSANTQGDLVSLTGPGDSTMLALLRIITPPEGDARYRFIIAADSHSIDGPLGRFRVLLAIFLGLLALGLTVAAVMQVAVGLRPLARLRERLSDVRTGRSTRIEGHFPTEIQPMVDEFNAVLHNNGEIVERARTQAGNLAHALKTPLSVLANGAAQEDTPFGRMVSEQVELAGRQVGHHLARARAAAAVHTPGRRIEVAPVIDDLARVMAQLYSDKGVQLHTETIPAGLFFHGEQQDLQELMGNLMENACKWADRNVRVTAEAAAPAASATKASLTPDHATAMIVLRVDDDGHGLSPDQRDAIFQRGVRMDERKPGSGLGLAIVRDLASAYGGSVQARASSLGGLGIDLQLPGEAAARRH